MIDALRVCYQVKNPYHIEQLQTLKVGERYDFPDFHLYRVEGKRFENVYAIRYYEPNEGNYKTFAHLKFNMKKSADPADFNDPEKVWIWIENWVFYDFEALHYLPFIAEEIGLSFHNITCLDLCIDVPFDIPRKLRRLIKSKKNITILNSKGIRNRDIDRPEISYVMSGSLNKTDKYLTVNVKQKKAIKDKAKGATLTCYDKLGEILNSSDKSYIKKAYGNPAKLFRLEIHLNNAEVRDFFAKYNLEVEEGVIYDQNLRTVMFIEFLDSIVKFDTPSGRLDWSAMLGSVITTTPVSDYLKLAKNMLKETYA